MKTSSRTAAGLVALVGLMPVWSGGCASSPSTDGMAQIDQAPVLALVETGDASYETVFDAAREVLSDYRFAINRVDAARGVLTTYPKRTAGLASPWDREQGTLAQSWEDLVNQQQRVVRVGFERPDDEDTPVRVTVEVELLRSHRPNWRVEPESVRLSTHAVSRDSQGRRDPASFDEVIGIDTDLAQRLARAIELRLVSE